MGVEGVECKHTHTDTHTRILATKKKGILPFVTTWVDLESIKLNEMSQKKTNAFCCYLYVES